MRTISEPSGHRVRLAFPRGRRQRGSGQLVSILHPLGENPCTRNPLQILSKKYRGKTGFSIVGTDPHGRYVRIFTISRESAERIKEKIGQGQEINVPDFQNPNFQEKVRDVGGREWFFNVFSSPKGFTAEGYPISGKRLKRVGKPVVVHAATEAEAQDRLIAKIENPAKENPRTYEFKVVGERRRWKERLETDLDANARAQQEANAIGKTVTWRYRGSRGAFIAEGPRTYFSEGLYSSELTRAPRKQRSGKAFPSRNPADEGPKRRNPRHSWRAYFVLPTGEKYGREAPSKKEAWKDAAHILHVEKPDFLSAVESYGVERLGKGNPRRFPKRCNPNGLKALKARLRFLHRIARQGERVEDQIKDTMDEIERFQARKNPNGSLGTKDLYKTFHGEPSQETLEIYQKLEEPKDYASLGDLLAIKIVGHGGEIGFDNGDQVILASTANGRQLYFIGGNQDLSGLLGNFNVDSSKNLIDLGPVAAIAYRTRKDFDGFAESDYVHQMGEHGHQRPRLLFDKVNSRMQLVGGEYKVKREGIIH